MFEGFFDERNYFLGMMVGSLFGEESSSRRGNEGLPRIGIDIAFEIDDSLIGGDVTDSYFVGRALNSKNEFALELFIREIELGWQIHKVNYIK